MKCKNFGGLPDEYSKFENSKIVIVPVPYDGTSTWIKGADKGPEALIEASCNMELYDITADKEIYKVGIHTADPVRERRSPEKVAKDVEVRITQLLKKKKFPVILGGEHSVSIGAFKAFADFYKGADFTILQFDAHADMRQEYEGSKYNHACVMARASELAPVLQVGIRSMSYEERADLKPERLFYANYILDSNNTTWMYDLLNKLGKNVYITIDLDVFDPSIMASTGTPEPGGMQWYPMLELLEKINQKTNIVGFDVVELCPMKYNKAPNFMAAKLVYQLLTYRFGSLIKD
ncbi:MAG TPA: agmatinase [Lentimicrobium sp.]|nr:agmatinase [Lentimicrobium sp.]